MPPYISVVIPTLNEEEYLPRLLTDLTKQVSKNFEVIVADASEDSRTKDAAFAIKPLYPFHFYTAPKRKLASQRNFGASYATGTYLIFLDADTRIPPDFTKNFEASTREEPGLVYRPYTVPEEKKFVEVNTLFIIWNIIVELSFLTASPFGDGGCMIFERNFFNTIGCYNERLFVGEDHEIMRRSVKWGVRPKLIPRVVAIFSLRRMQREGRLKLLYKYTLIGIHSFLKLDMKEGTVSYDMGGRVVAGASLSTSTIRAIKDLLSKDYVKSLQKAIRKISDEE